jgi:hypothetical protein
MAMTTSAVIVIDAASSSWPWPTNGTRPSTIGLITPPAASSSARSRDSAEPSIPVTPATTARRLSTARNGEVTSAPRPNSVTGAKTASL